MTRLIALAAFLMALTLQGLWWGTQGVYDAEIWGMQPIYMLEGDPGQFNGAAAYGHPGGPIIYATALVEAFELAPESALLVALTLLMSLVIAFVAVQTYWLSGRWWVAAISAVFFAAHPLYGEATPPSAFAAMLAVALTLQTLIIHRERTRRTLLIGALLAGLLVATRADIGSVLSLVLALSLLSSVGLRRLLPAAGAATVVFVLFDPFMWFMPFQHLYDLAFKAYYHYAVIPAQALPLPGLLLAASFAIVSILLSAGALARRASTVPPHLFLMLLGLTIGLTGVWLTAEYQAYRYFMPIIFIWQALLPLSILALTATLPRVTLYRFALFATLLAYPLIHFALRLL